MEGNTTVQEPRWQEVSLGADAWPARRHGHTAVVVCHHSCGGPALCVYGGFGDDGRPLDDLSLFGFLKGEWRAVKKAKATPVGRHSHTAVVWRDSMFVFGGATADPSGVPSGQLLEFNFRKAAWSEVKTKGDQPKPRWGHSAVLVAPQQQQSAAAGGEEDGASMWVFGGFTTTGVDNDLFRFHFRTKTWERVSASADGAAEGPSARHLHSAVVSPDGESMVVVGGFSGSGSVNFADAWSFHFGTRKWRALEVPDSFTGRRGHRAAVVVPSTGGGGGGGGGGGVMVVHGGRDKAGPLDDLHLFRFDDETWSHETQGSTEGWPSGRYFHSLTPWAGRLWTFGGLGVDVRNDDGKSHNLNELHQFCCPAIAGGEGAYFYDFARPDDDEEELNAGGGKTALRRKRADFINVLPAELSLHILSFLPMADVGATLPRVSKAWQRFVEDDALWRDAVSAFVQDLAQRNLGHADSDALRQKTSCKAQLKKALESNPFHDTSLSFSYKDAGEIKVVVLGAGGVGKSALTIMFIQNHFIEEYDPTIEDNYRKMVLINDHTVLLDILDTAGPEEFSAMRSQWIRTGTAFVMVYSVTNRASFEEIEPHQWDLVLRVKDTEPFSAILVGNKSDVDTHEVYDWQRKVAKREVTFEEGAALARKMSVGLGRVVPFIETSAKFNINVTTAFTGLAYMEMQRKGLVGAAKNNGQARKEKPTTRCLLS